MNIFMLDSFVKTFTGPCMIGQRKPVLACCSGGVDSMVLLDLLVRAAGLLHLRLGVVHVDHGIRGESSRSDARFVEECCAKLGLPCHVYRLSLGLGTPNLEEEARHKRYQAIRACMKEHGYEAAATGHTMDDQAETVIYRFIRGSGVRGLGGMELRNSWGLIRPLLVFTRAQVEEYAELHRVPSVEDATNTDVALARNLIRHEIIPAMKKINPSVIGSACRLADIARREGELVEDLSKDIEKSACEHDWGMVRVYRSRELVAAPRAVTERMVIRVLSDMLGEPRGIDASQVEAIMDVVAGFKRAHTVKRRVRAQSGDGSVIFCPAGPGPFYELPVDRPGLSTITSLGQRIRIHSEKDGALQLSLRSLLPGDRIGDERVVRVLADNGIVKELRPFWPVLVSSGTVVSVAGVRDMWPEAGLRTEFPCHE
jgi:tRNA(Ile)-lysidine synthase